MLLQIIRVQRIWSSATSRMHTHLLALLPAAGGAGQTSFVDDAILIERYHTEFKDEFWTVSTAGSISVHVNSNREGQGGHNDNWLDFAVGWCECNRDTTAGLLVHELCR